MKEILITFLIFVQAGGSNNFYNLSPKDMRSIKRDIISIYRPAGIEVKFTKDVRIPNSQKCRETMVKSRSISQIMDCHAQQIPAELYGKNVYSLIPARRRQNVQMFGAAFVCGFKWQQTGGRAFSIYSKSRKTKRYGVLIDDWFPITKKVIAHELGHLMGAVHTNNYNALMYPYIQFPYSPRHTRLEQRSIKQINECFARPFENGYGQIHICKHYK